MPIHRLKSLVLAATAAGATLCATLAQAQPFEFKSTTGGWNIFVNEATQGCFMERETEQGIVWQIGTEAGMLGVGGTDNFGFMAFYVPGERPVDVNDQEVVIVTIGPNTYFGTTATIERDGYYGGVVVSKDETLEFDLRNRLTMEILVSSGARVEVQLAQSDIDAAMQATRACQAEIAG